MTKNAAKINAGIKALVHRPNEIITGTVVPGSVDESAYTISVQPCDDSSQIRGVLLNAITNNGNGMILFPEMGAMW